MLPKLPLPATVLASLTLLLLPLTGHAQKSPSSLPNGIELPALWPPLRDWRPLNDEPPNIPYLNKPPEVIPIDLGRQLFVDDFLIERTTLERTHHRASLHPASPVVVPDKPWEDGVAFGPMSVPFSDGVWHDPADGLFKMWYMGGFARHTCLATSRNGIDWNKPRFDVVDGTNVVHPGTRDSSTVWLDLEEENPEQRYKMFRVTNEPDEHPEKWPPEHSYKYLAWHTSPDGVHWSEPRKPLMKIWGDRTTVFHNPFRGAWGYSLRTNKWGQTVKRSRAYFETSDLMHPRFAGTRPGGEPRGITPWVTTDKLDLADPRYPDAKPQLYNLDAVAYENLMLGLFSVMRNRSPKINDICVGYSRDGFHWHRPLRETFISVPREEQWTNNQSAGGVCLIVGDRLHFYFGGSGVTGLATLRRDGFASMDAGQSGGTLTTRPVRFSGSHLFVNVAAAKGELRVEVLDEDGNTIEPYSAAACEPVTADSTIQRIFWRDAPDLKKLVGETVRFRFHLRNGSLYSFWVSADEQGRSGGYVSAGGPGFTTNRDDAGQAAYRAADQLRATSSSAN